MSSAAVQAELAALAAGEQIPITAEKDGDLDQFLKGLATAWHEGEARPTHRDVPKPARHWRTRKDAFQAVWPCVLLWLQDEPDRTALELLGRLQKEHPGEFPDRQLRTLQRRVKLWRRAAARKLVFTADLSMPDVA